MSRPSTPKPKKDLTSRFKLPWKKKVEAKTVVGAASVILAAITPVLEDLSDVASHVGIPAAKFGITCISQVLKRAEQMSTTKERVETLRLRISKLSHTLQAIEGPKRGGELPVSIQKRLDSFAQEWSKIENDADELVKAGVLERFANSQQDADKLSQLVERISESIHNLSLHSSLSTELHVLDMHSMMVQDAAKKEEALPFRHAVGARYDHNDARGKCLNNTRVEFLRDLRDWIRNDDDDDDDAKDSDDGEGNDKGEGKLILWLNGAAGSGKTTIAYDMAEWCDDSGRLLASFFCARSDSECNDVGLIVTTVVHQLCLRSPAFRDRVLEVVKKDPSVLEAGVRRQVKELLAQPFKQMDGALRDKVIIIDALDECKDKTAVSTLLDALLPHLSNSNWPKIVITSRPEQYIRASLESTTTKRILHEVPIPVVEADITTFLNSSFPRIRRTYGLPKNWPEKENIAALARLCGGLFVVASTAVKFISRPQPHRRLQLLLDMETSSQGIVDDLYRQIAVDYSSEIDDDGLKTLSTILGALVVLQRPLSPAALAALLDLEEFDVRSTLAGLHSVLLVPEDNENPIQFFHLTFPEFLTRTSTSSQIPPAFHVETDHSHLLMLQRILGAMGALKRDIIDVKHPGTVLEEIPDVRQKVSAAIPPELEYACRYWDSHLCALSPDMLSAAAQPLHEFVSIQLLFWLEACILLDGYHDAIGMLDASERACRGAKDLTPETAPLLADCRRFALAYIECIHDAPLQIYHFALALVPRSSILMQTYKDLLKHSVVVSQGAEEDWGPCISSFAGHGGKSVYAVAFSPDGGSFATGGEDKKVKIWRTLTCGLLLSIDHDDDVRVVAFSPDGTRIISLAGSHLQIWDTSTGNHIQDLRRVTSSGTRSNDSTDSEADNFNDITSISYCADGQRIVATESRSERIWVWDMPESKGRCMDAFQGNGIGSDIVAVLPNLALFACSDGEGLRIRYTPWILPSDTQRRQFKSFEWVTISPDGRYAAVSEDSALHIWTPPDRQLVRSIHIPDSHNQITLFVFSPDSTQIACTLNNGQVLLWPVPPPESASPRIFARHSGWISDISWSPIDPTLVSIGNEGIYVWDTTPCSRGETPTLQPPVSATMPRVITYIDVFINLGERCTDVIVLDLPSSSPFSSCNNVIQLPDDASGTLTLHSDAASAWGAASQALLEGIPDWGLVDACRQMLLSGRRTIHVHPVIIYDLLPRPRPVISDHAELFAYIPTNSRHTVNVHNIRTGITVATLAHHPALVSAITFSPDSSHIACGLEDGSISIWALDTQAELARHVSQRSLPVKYLTFSPNGRLVTAAQDDGSAEIFEASTGRSVATPSEHPRFAEILFISDDAHLVGRTWETHLDSFSIWEAGRDTEPPTLHELGAALDTIQAIANFVVDNTPSTNLKAQRWPRYLEWGGWVHAIGPRGANRVARPPPGFELLPSFGADLHMLDRSRRRVVSFDMSHFLKYTDSL